MGSLSLDAILTKESLNVSAISFVSVIKLSSMLSLKQSVLTFFLFDAPSSLKKIPN